MTARERSYATPVALRQALEDRLKARSTERGEDLARLRRLVAFDRVLARLFHDEEDAPWIVKGGFGLEVRYRLKARTTKDLDLSLPDLASIGSESGVGALLLDRLQTAAERDLGDGFVIAIGAPGPEFQAPPQGGGRYPVEVRLAGRRFASFHIDVGIGDAVLEAPEWASGEEFLSFAGIPAARIPLLPVAQQFAEKVHAYTLPRESAVNTRVKDLVDLVLLLEIGSLNPDRVSAAVRATFERRVTHPVPELFPEPPATWSDSFAELAGQAGLAARTIESAHTRLAGFWSDIVLSLGSSKE